MYMDRSDFLDIAYINILTHPVEMRKEMLLLTGRLRVMHAKKKGNEEQGQRLVHL